MCTQRANFRAKPLSTTQPGRSEIATPGRGDSGDRFERGCRVRAQLVGTAERAVDALDLELAGGELTGGLACLTGTLQRVGCRYSVSCGGDELVLVDESAEQVASLHRRD